MNKTPFAVAALLCLFSTAIAAADSPPEGTPISTKIRKVTVYSDRARVTRTGQATLAGSRQRLIVPDLPVGIADASVSATSKTAKILSIEVETVYGKQTANKDAEALIEKGKGLDRQERGVQDELAALAEEERYLRAFQVKTHPDEKGHPIPVTLEPGAWQASLSFVSDGLASVLSRERVKQAEQRELGKQHQALDVELNKVRSYQSAATKVIALEVEGSAGPADLEVTYSIGGPSWRPAYDVRVASATGKVEVTTHGVISQQTGEDWKDVDLTLSTARPAEGADVPKLLAWRLGDADQFAYAAANGPVGAAGAGLAEESSTHDEQARVTVAAAPPTHRASRSSGLFGGSPRSAPAAPAPQPVAKAEDKPAPDMDGNGDVGGDSVDTSEVSVNGSTANENTYIVDGVTQSTENLLKVAPGRQFSSTISAAPGLSDDSASAGGAADFKKQAQALQDNRRRESQQRAQRDQAPLQQAIDTTAANYPRLTGENVWSLPAGHAYHFLGRPNQTRLNWQAGNSGALFCPPVTLSAGGFDYAFKPERRSTVLSDGRERKVRLATTTFPAELVYEVVSPISTRAYLRATIVNNTRQPFLAGEAFVFLDDDFAGRAFIETVASSAKMELSLGTDDDVKVERRVEQSAENTGLFTKKEKTAYTVSVAIKSFKKRPIEMLLRDDVPITWQKDDITVETGTLSPAPLDEKSGSVPSKGLYAWKLSLPPGGKQDVKISYTVEHPRDFDMVENRGNP